MGSEQIWPQSIARTQPRDVDDRWFGTIMTLAENTRFFLGLRSEWIGAVQQQDFKRIAVLDFDAESQNSALSIPGLFEERTELGERPRIAADRSPQPRLTVAHLHTTRSGRVFGLVGDWAGRQGNDLVVDE